MIEETVLNYLISKGFCAVMEEEGLEGDYLVIEKAGGSGDKMLSNSVITIQSYSKSLAGAAKKKKKMINAMYGIIELPEICRCELNSNYNFTDTARKRYRYQAVFNITHY